MTLFRAAASCGGAWRDNPFLPRTGRCCPTFDLYDYVAPRRMAKGDELRVAEARDACLTRAGQLFVVDGVVHKTADAPVAGFGTVVVNKAEVTRPMWIMGDIGSTSSMDTVGHDERPGTFWSHGLPMAEALGHEGGSFARGEGLLCLSTWGALIEAVRKAFQRSRAFDPWSPHATDLARLVDVPTTPDVRGCLDVAARLAKRLWPMEGSPAPGTADACRTLWERLDLLATCHGDEFHDAFAFLELQHVGEDLQGRFVDDPAPHAGMWTYVAAITFHAATWELETRGADDMLADLRI